MKPDIRTHRVSLLEEYEEALGRPIPSPDYNRELERAAERIVCLVCAAIAFMFLTGFIP